MPTASYTDSVPTERPLIGSILERKPKTAPLSPSPKFNTSGKTGFPTVQHRSKSAFARAREGMKRQGPDRPREPPVVQQSSQPQVPPATPPRTLQRSDTDDWRAQIDEENRRRIENMTEEEREQERQEILERFGPNVTETLRRAREAREGQRGQSSSPPGEKLSAPSDVKERISSPKSARAISPPSALSRPSSTRPPSRTDRKLRFADVGPSDIHVYESAPPSPRRKPLALPPPTPDDGPTISLGDWRGRVSRLPNVRKETSTATVISLPSDNDEEGTPEYIRHRFFPTAPANDPSLAWMESATPESSSSEQVSSDLRFDLTGKPIPPSLTSTLPTHLGLHHHAEGTHAGYTLDDIFMLSRSTVPAQRATMLGVLARIAHRLARGRKGDEDCRIEELAGREDELRKRMLAAGVEAMGERGSLGARAVEVLWECIVGWDEELLTLEGVELSGVDAKGTPSTSTGSPADLISSLPLDFILPQISNSLAAADLPPESLSQLLAILHRLAQHSNEIATKIVTTPAILPNVFKTFLLTPIPPTKDSPAPEPAALQLLCALASSSRSNASAIVEPTDALLRFVITLPPASPYSRPLATALLVGTLRLYTVLASYGLYAQIATTASQSLAQVGEYVLSEQCDSHQLREAWLLLLEAWMVCARDPHQTTPDHDILWSQVAGWNWGEEALRIRSRLENVDEQLWAPLWGALAAWQEGAKVNGIKGGEQERATVIDAIAESFTNGTEIEVVDKAGLGLAVALKCLEVDGTKPLQVDDLVHLEAAGRHAKTLACAMRLWLSCLPPHTVKPDSPPFLLPFAQLSEISALIATHPLWTSLFMDGTPGYAHVFCRPLSLLLSTYLRFSRTLPDISDDAWIAQTFSILTRLLPGDEEPAQYAAKDVMALVSADFMQARGWHAPPVIWEKGGLDIIKPFLMHALRPNPEAYVGPVWMSPRSIALASTQRLPPLSALRLNTRREQPLPLHRDWMFTPVDHLLRSAQSDVFKSLPSSWDASETEVVRATLLFARVSQEVLRLHNLGTFLMSREETVFACVKVFMLEHGQQQSDSVEEVFRDIIVGQFMDALVAPFTVSTAPQLTQDSTAKQDNLEVVAARFLGSGTPFYQFYTDFVGLYDAISFSHPLFARLLLPPTSMRYAVDYRKYLWADYAHVVKTIRTLPDQVITADLKEHLWPVETDSEAITAYLRVLIKGGLEGVVRLVAVHHVACNIWPDLREAKDGDEKAGKLLKAVVDQGGFDAVRDVMLYRQVLEGPLLLPPACFDQTGEWRRPRLDFVERFGGDAVKDRVQKLFEI
ncbi:hypothetical protein CERSUDRAFT_111906 [Gelatoporia subvermispora B]|uniref:RNA polymerase II-associated protein 1 C-terminal domain-containing protein n=1 Tax=Ceriporiopsis subvermispora (strain B) TaxID=914234 RepID=M2RM96_CERS8|nr:hypothetical protein CERSUDRAFT_111906 [Gelatoporia subvermispora B]